VSPAHVPYGSASAFRQALEERLRARAVRDGLELSRLRRLVSVDRLLARLFADGERAPWIVKGGYALEVRFALNGRATRDLDLAIPSLRRSAMASLIDELTRAVGRDVEDFFQLGLGERRLDLGGAPEGGVRFHASVDLDGRRFDEFHVDVALGEESLGAPNWMSSPGLLEFAGITAARVAMTPLPQHFAEKVHAITRPRGGYENTRVRDLLDIALMIENGLMPSDEIVTAIEQTFARGGTHPVPPRIPQPPPAWNERYAELAAGTQVRANTMMDAQALLSEF
jgi:hypothetical protein